MGVSVKTERFGIARQWNARIIDVRAQPTFCDTQYIKAMDRCYDS